VPTNNSTLVAARVVHASSSIVGALHSTGEGGPVNRSMNTVAGTTVVEVVGGTVDDVDVVVEGAIVVVDATDEVLVELVVSVTGGSPSLSLSPHAAASNTSTRRTTRKERIVRG
jgi:hypothetical protein